MERTVGIANINMLHFHMMRLRFLIRQRLVEAGGHEHECAIINMAAYHLCCHAVEQDGSKQKQQNYLSDHLLETGF